LGLKLAGAPRTNVFGALRGVSFLVVIVLLDEANNYGLMTKNQRSLP
jgi:hypothetical protein